MGAQGDDPSRKVRPALAVPKVRNRRMDQFKDGELSAGNSTAADDNHAIPFE
jgi:hypothetical protein